MDCSVQVGPLGAGDSQFGFNMLKSVHARLIVHKRTNLGKDRVQECTSRVKCYPQIVASVEDIEDAILRLTPQDYARFLEWFRERDQQVWDEQMDRDAAAGKLDFLRREAKEARQSGLVRDWPPAE
jgi:hypothetical protein